MLTPSQERKRDELVQRLLRTDQRIDVYMDEERLYEGPHDGAVYVGTYWGSPSPAPTRFSHMTFRDDLTAAMTELRARRVFRQRITPTGPVVWRYRGASLRGCETT